MGSITEHPLFAKGFRPFFLLGAVMAIGFVPFWVWRFDRGDAGAAYLPGLEWHRHEMLFGYTVAIIAGFLLTAVTNWTDLPTATGGKLVALCLVWAAGRVALLGADLLPGAAVAALDLAFLPGLIACVAPPLWVDGSRRNYVLVPLLLVFFAANLGVHLEANGVYVGLGGRATQVALDVVVVLMVLLGGRVIPYFTSDALDLPDLPEPEWLEPASVAAAALVLVGDLLALPVRVTGVAALVAAALAGTRLACWQRAGVWKQALLWSLHLGFGWIVVGLFTRATALGLGWFPDRVATHVLTVGAIGSLTLGMMARVALGHTGRELEAAPPVRIAFGLLSFATVIRVAVPFLAPGWYFESLVAAGGLWSLAFSLYLWVYWPILMQPRADGNPG